VTGEESRRRSTGCDGRSNNRGGDDESENDGRRYASAAGNQPFEVLEPVLHDNEALGDRRHIAGSGLDQEEPTVRRYVVIE